MTSTTAGASDVVFHRPRVRAQRPRRDWSRALQAIRALIVDKENTAEVFALFRALNGNSSFHGYTRLLETDEGGRLAYERVELCKRLEDPEWTKTFPPGSVGDAYLNYLCAHQFTPQALEEESHKGLSEEEWDPKHPYAWYERRIRDVHDIWHVLLGYDRDHLGEICLLAFAYQEAHGLGRGFLVFAAWLRAHGPAAGQARKSIAEATRRGKRAAWLPGLDYEKLLMEPLDQARRRVGLTTPVEYEKVPLDDRDLAVT